jgi:hypothetical protein
VEMFNRITIFLVVVVVAVFAIQFLDLPVRLLNIVVNFFVSFRISGGIYGLLSTVGLEYLENIKFRYSLSPMTITVFLLKHLVI